MVGGTVIEVCDHPTNRDMIFIDCAEMPRGHSKPDTCAIYVQRDANSERIKIGDSIWWQGRYAMWTPQENIGNETARQNLEYDIQIPRIGHSGVEHPSRSQHVT